LFCLFIVKLYIIKIPIVIFDKELFENLKLNRLAICVLKKLLTKYIIQISLSQSIILYT